MQQKTRRESLPTHDYHGSWDGVEVYLRGVPEDEVETVPTLYNVGLNIVANLPTEDFPSIKHLEFNRRLTGGAMGDVWRLIVTLENGVQYPLVVKIVSDNPESTLLRVGLATEAVVGRNLRQHPEFQNLAEVFMVHILPEDIAEANRTLDNFDFNSTVPAEYYVEGSRDCAFLVTRLIPGQTLHAMRIHDPGNYIPALIAYARQQDRIRKVAGCVLVDNKLGNAIGKNGDVTSIDLAGSFFPGVVGYPRFRMGDVPNKIPTQREMDLFTDYSIRNYLHTLFKGKFNMFVDEAIARVRMNHLVNVPHEQYEAFYYTINSEVQAQFNNHSHRLNRRKPLPENDLQALRELAEHLGEYLVSNGFDTDDARYFANFIINTLCGSSEPEDESASAVIRATDIEPMAVKFCQFAYSSQASSVRQAQDRLDDQESATHLNRRK